MELKEISINEFESFVKTAPSHNFFQSGYMKMMFDLEHKENYLLGLFDNNTIVGASLIVARNKFLGYKCFEAVKGFITDYHNKNYLQEFTNLLYRFIKTKKGNRLLINPYLPVIKRDTDANIVEGDINNYDIINTLEEIGYKNRGAGVQVKWTYCLDIAPLTKEELFSQFKPNTRNYINRTINKYQLECKTLKYEELKEFKKITSDTCKRRGFGDKNLSYYENMYKTFGDLVTFKIVSLNCDTYINILNEENLELQHKIDELSDSASNKKKKEVMKNELLQNKEKIKETKQLKKDKGNIIPLSGAMFMLYGDELIYLFSGSYKEYMNFCGQYRLQWEIIKYGAENGYRRYNFFGINDVFDKSGKDYGVYEFKKGFNGYVEELMDVYEYGKGFIYHIYHLLKRLKR